MKHAWVPVAALLILVASSPACAAPFFTIAAPADGIRVEEELPGFIKLDLYIEMTRPFDKISSELVDRFDDGRFQVLVDGVEKTVVWHGGGNGSTETMAYRDRSILVSPGPAPGLKRIEIRLGDLRREVTLDYRPVTRLLAVGLRDDLAFFLRDGGPAICTFVATNIAPESVTARVNNVEVQPRVVIDGPNDNLVRLFVPVSISHAVGRNRVRVSATDRDGRETHCEVFIRYYPENIIPAGEEFVVAYGVPGGKSGPWYGCEVEGESLRLLHYLDDEAFPWTLDDFGRVYSDMPQFARITAVRSGPGKILFYETPHFTMPEALVQTVEVAVVDSTVLSTP